MVESHSDLEYDGDNWSIWPTEGFLRDLRRMRKRHPKEVSGALVNPDTYVAALREGVLPRNVSAGFIHPEGRGVVAIDQGACGPNAAEIRLYIRPGDRIVFLIAIGDKRSQQADIARAHQFVEQMRRNR